GKTRWGHAPTLDGGEPSARAGAPSRSPAKGWLTRGRPPRLRPGVFTAASAHLLAMEAHEGQVHEDGGDYYLHLLVPLAEAARPYRPLAEMGPVLHRRL